MIIRLILCVFFVSFFSIGNAQQLPLLADSIVKEATSIALKENKNVFIIFHASWCIWCRRMDSSINDVKCKQFFQDNYVIRHLVVHESKSKKSLENPGALNLLDKYNAAEEGLPFWMVIDKEGMLLADSRLGGIGENAGKKGQNTGCPATAEEVKYFIEVLQKTSHINEEQAEIIGKRFRENESQ